MFLQQFFQSYGLEAFLDKSELSPGDKLRKELEGKIKESHYFVPILTPAYMSSSWCLREFEIAAEHDVTIIPIKTTADRLVAPPDMREIFNEKAHEPKYLDLTSRGYLDELRQLVDKMTA
ncbi:MAG: toll/interleukin-1 receptor domain-containing protein [Desulfovermiculus sp.]